MPKSVAKNDLVMAIKASGLVGSKGGGGDGVSDVSEDGGGGVPVTVDLMSDSLSLTSSGNVGMLMPISESMSSSMLVSFSM